MVVSGGPGVLVTRPAGQAADELCALLEAHGYRALKEPMLLLEGQEQLPRQQQSLIRDLDCYQHIIFISTNAVRFGLHHIDRQWPRLPGRVQWYAIGAATARQLAGRGVSAHTPQEQMTSEGLLDLPQLQSVRDARVLIVKGEGGRDTLRQELEARGANVDELVCYRRLPPRVSADAIAARLSEGDIGVILFSSGEGLSNFRRLLRPAETNNLGSMCLVVPSERVARMAGEMGFERIAIADNASDTAMLQALEGCRPELEGNK